MPTLGWGHSAYWSDLSTVVTPPPPAVQSKGGYPGWQSGVILPSGLGMLSAWLSTWWDRLKWWRKLAPAIHSLPDHEKGLLLEVLRLLRHTEYPLALKSVKKTATTLGFNRPEAWIELGRLMKQSNGLAENTYRHMEACRLLQANLISSTLSRPETNLLIELAYHRYAGTKGKGIGDL